MTERYRSLAQSVFAGRRFLLIGGPVVGLAALARQLRALGAERPFLLGSGIGTGPLPEPELAEWRALDVAGADMMSAMWEYERRLGALPADLSQAIEAWDPGRRALALGAIVLGDVPAVAGRPRWGARPRAWAELEDKTLVHELFDAAGVRRGPLAVVRADEAALRAAARELDRGAGTVWAGDANPGIHGGASHLRRVADDAGAREAAKFFSGRCARVRVMPFLEGVPCSIHGLVLERGVAVFRPMEMLTLRRPHDTRFVYAGSASYWDPAPSDRAELRAIAARVGRALAQRVRFRGAFALDGVLAAEGFVPTELNPRVGGALQHLFEASRGIPLLALALAAQAGEPLDLDPAELETEVLEFADAHRSGGPRLVVAARWSETRTWTLVDDAARGWRPALEGEAADAVLSAGPNDAGGFVFFAPVRPRVGPSYAPEAVRALAAVDALAGAGIGPLEAARPAR